MITNEGRYSSVYTARAWREWFEDKMMLACVHVTRDDVRVAWVGEMSEDAAREMLLSIKGRTTVFDGELAQLAETTALATDQIKALTITLRAWNQTISASSSGGI